MKKIVDVKFEEGYTDEKYNKTQMYMMYQKNGNDKVFSAIGLITQEMLDGWNVTSKDMVMNTIEAENNRLGSFGRSFLYSISTDLDNRFNTLYIAVPVGNSKIILQTPIYED